MTATLTREVKKLSQAQKIQLAENLWDQVATEGDALPVPESHKELLNARLALYTHDQSGYAAALQDASHWLDQAFDADAPAVSGLRQQLQQLAGHDIAPSAPDLSPSIQTLSRYLPAAPSAETP